MAELIRLKELMPDYYTNVLEMNKLLEVEQIVLDDFLRNVESQQKNQFVMTADEAGIRLWETVVGIDTDSSLDLETRRFNVLARLMPPKPVTKRYMKELLKLLNINAKLIVHVNDFHVDVQMETTDQQATLRLKSLLEGLLPANLTFTNQELQRLVWERWYQLVTQLLERRTNMSLYKQWFITTMLRDALQGGANSNNKVTFKRMVASNDLISEKDFPGLTNESMQTIKTNQSTLISSTTTKGNVVTITSVFNSFAVTEEYKMNTIYLVAEYNSREFLAAITSANDPYTMPVESKTEHAEYTIKAQLGLSNSSTVDLNMDPEAVATNEQLSVVDKKHTNAFKKLKDMIDSLFEIDKDNIKTKGTQTIDGTKTYLQKIIGSVSGSAAKLEIARKINGILFDGTKDITIEAKPSNDSNIVHKTGNEDVAGIKKFLDGLVGNLKGNADTATQAKNSELANKATLADDATKLKTPRKINGVDFDGTKNINVNAANDSNIVHKDGAETVSGVKSFTEKIIASISGTAGTAIKLLTARKINGVNFDGTKDIVIEAKPNNDKDIFHKSKNEKVLGNNQYTGKNVFDQVIEGFVTGTAIKMYSSSSAQQDLNDLTYLKNMRIGTIESAYYTDNKVLNNPIGSEYFIVERRKLTQSSVIETITRVAHANGKTMQRLVNGLNATPKIGDWGVLAEWGQEWKSLKPYLNKSWTSLGADPVYRIVGDNVEIMGDLTPVKTLINSKAGIGSRWTLAKLPVKFLPHQAVLTQGTKASTFLLMPEEDGTLTILKYLSGGVPVDIEKDGSHVIYGTFKIKQ